MGAGKLILQANDGKTLSLVAPEGMSGNTTDVVATESRLNSHIGLSGVTAYHLLQGNLAVDNTGNLQIQNAIIPFANGIDANGTKITTLSKNETISGLTLTAGKNYVYSKNDGTYGVKNIAPNYGKTNPANGGDFYDILENKWYTSAGTEITESRNYLNHIVYADNDGSPLYVEELPKIEYKDIIKANELNVLNGFNLNQTLYDKKSERIFESTYWNTTNKPIKVYITAASYRTVLIGALVNDIYVAKQYIDTQNDSHLMRSQFSFEVPPFSYYKLTKIFGTLGYAIDVWAELR